MARCVVAENPELASSKTLGSSYRPKKSCVHAYCCTNVAAAHTNRRTQTVAASLAPLKMLKTLLAAALLITFIKLLLWCTAPLRSSRDTALDEDAREAWLKRRPKEQVQLSIVVPA